MRSRTKTSRGSSTPPRLRRGPGTAIDFLRDGVIHAADGRTTRVRVPYAKGRLALLGRTQGSWAVASRRDAFPGMPTLTRRRVAALHLVQRGWQLTHIRDVAARKWIGRTRVMDWVSHSTCTRIATVAVAADLGHDLLWVRANGRIFGPTSLSAPDAPAWAAPFPPLGLSPEGATAAG